VDARKSRLWAAFLLISPDSRTDNKRSMSRKSWQIVRFKNPLRATDCRERQIGMTFEMGGASAIVSPRLIAVCRSHHRAVSMRAWPSPLNLREAKRVCRPVEARPARNQRIGPSLLKLMVAALGLPEIVWYGTRDEVRMKDSWKQILAKLGSGLAHEIRNPLHALRINLHVLRRSFGGHSTLSEEQLVATIRESNAAIDRLDLLMRDLLQLSDPSVGNASEVNLVHEVQSALELLDEELKRERISVRSNPKTDSISIKMDPARLRHSLLSLLTFAQQRAGNGGSIEVSIVRRDHGVEINIADSGPALTSDQSEHLFEPFQAPMEWGTGLGLALAQMNLESAGGRATWDSTAAGSGCCRVWFPIAAN
jgi:signal transduction histidine kinase